MVYRELSSHFRVPHGYQDSDFFLDGGEDLQKVIIAAFNRYVVSNPLHPDVFPAIRKMEAKIVAMCLSMYNNPYGAGTTTSGGTESIVMAVKMHCDWARAVKGGMSRPSYQTLGVH